MLGCPLFLFLSVSRCISTEVIFTEFELVVISYEASLLNP